MRKKVVLVILVLSLLLLTSCTIEDTTDSITGDFRLIDWITKDSGNTLKCSDSDGGINLAQKGITSLLSKKAHFPEESKTDFCGRNNKLVEFYCNRGHNKIEKTIKDCKEYGDDWFCKGGKCMKESCDNLILTGEEYEEEIQFNRCGTIFGPNDLKIKFTLQGGLIGYATREFQGEELLIEYHDFEIIEEGNFWSLKNVYADGLEIGINSYDESTLDIVVINNCINKHPYCARVSEETNLSTYIFHKEGIYEYYVESQLLPNEELEEAYFEKLVQGSQWNFNLLEENLGFVPPVNKIVEIKYYTSSGGAGSSGFFIYTEDIQPITEATIAEMGLEYPHEFVHVFFYGIPVKHSWFEEGLADYSRIIEGENHYSCHEGGWTEKTCSAPGFTIVNGSCQGPLVPYSNFSISYDNSAPFWSPLNRGSYYHSAQCFWEYLNETYGEEAIKEITQAWHDTRKTFPPEEKWLIKDIINPTLGVDLSDLVYERYSYIEGQFTIF